MKIVRHTAPDMRQALRAIREQLGEDAVILSSRRIGATVEVTAAVDFDAANLQNAAAQAAIAPVHAPVAPMHAAVTPAHAPAALMHTAVTPAHAPAAVAPTYAPAAPAQTALAPAHFVGTPAPLLERTVRPVAPTIAAPLVSAPAPRPADMAAQLLAELPAETAAPPAANSAQTDAMGRELKTLRKMLETQLEQLAWSDLARRAPVHVEILRELTEIGISQDLSDYILKQLPEKVELGFARRFAIAGLSQYLSTTSDRLLETGGRVAFVGTTGVGKTTTLAKMAVRWVLKNGPRDIALVSCDTVRIGAQDQIRSLGQLLGVPVYAPDRFESLPEMLSRLDGQRLVLIDTPGASARDTQLASRLSVLANCAPKLQTHLVLGASTQAGALEEQLKRFASACPACCVLTKVDEAASLGGALSVLIRARLPLSYISEGQRVPEDLRPARALELVSTAVRLAKTSGAAADEDILRRRFGKIAHAST